MTRRLPSPVLALLAALLLPGCLRSLTPLGCYNDLDCAAGQRCTDGACLRGGPAACALEVDTPQAMQDTSEASQPALALLGTGRLVYAWTDTEGDEAPMTRVRVSCREPGFLDASAEPLDLHASVPVDEPAVHAARSGDDLGLLWHGGGGGVHFARLAEDGEACVDGEPMTIDAGPAWTAGDLAAAPDGYVATWWDTGNSNAVLAVLDADGDLRVRHEVAQVGGRGRVAHTGSDDGLTRLVWLVEGYTDRSVLVAHRVLFDGDRDALDVAEGEAITESSGDSTDATLLWNEARGELAAAWRDTRDDDCGAIWFARLDGDGGSLAEVRVSDARGARSPALAWVPEREEYALVWADAAHLEACREDDVDDDVDVDIRLARISATGEVLETVRVSDFPGESRGPQVVWTGTEYAIVWFDWRAERQGVHYTRARCAE